MAIGLQFLELMQDQVESWVRAAIGGGWGVRNSQMSMAEGGQREEGAPQMKLTPSPLTQLRPVVSICLAVELFLQVKTCRALRIRKLLRLHLHPGEVMLRMARS